MTDLAWLLYGMAAGGLLCLVGLAIGLWREQEDALDVGPVGHSGSSTHETLGKHWAALKSLINNRRSRRQAHDEPDLAAGRQKRDEEQA